jgi:hypothetical protein
MATSKTGSFWLTEEVQLAAGNTTGQGTLDLGAYVDVGDQQALAVEQVDFIVQVHDTTLNTYFNSFVGTLAAADKIEVDFQLSDLNPGTALVSADENSLIASGHLLYDEATNTQSTGADFFPDSFGKLDESRMVVNDQLYFVAGLSGTVTLAANHVIQVCVRAKCRIVKLGTKDWMAIAIQSTAADN